MSLRLQCHDLGRQRETTHALKLTTWLMQNVDESKEIAAEYQTRMQALRGKPSTGWRLF